MNPDEASSISNCDYYIDISYYNLVTTNFASVVAEIYPRGHLLAVRDGVLLPG